MKQRICCNKPMIKARGTEHYSISGAYQTWHICKVCGSYYKEETGQLDFEEVINILGITEKELDKTWSE